MLKHHNEVNMIPTRLNQQFRDGYLSGFNPRTGNLLIVNNKHWEIGSGTVDVFKDAVNSILENKPDWFLPSIIDLESLHPYPNAEYLIKGVKRKQRYVSVYISSRSQDRNWPGTVIQLRINQTTSRCTTSSIESIFVPVFYISGRNCDQLMG